MRYWNIGNTDLFKVMETSKIGRVLIKIDFPDPDRPNVTRTVNIDMPKEDFYQLCDLKKKVKFNETN